MWLLKVTSSSLNHRSKLFLFSGTNCSIIVKIQVKVCSQSSPLSVHFPASLCRVTTAEELAVLEGRSITVPCHYDPQYAGYVKYWCRGRTREFCTSLARTDQKPSSNSAEEKVRIFDDPVQLVFTVTMADLKEEDSGWYLCGVEIGNFWHADVSAFTHIKVIHGKKVRGRQSWRNVFHAFVTTFSTDANNQS